MPRSWSLPAPPRELPRVRTSAEWIEHFTANDAGQARLPWEGGAGASPEELAPIADSLRAWQLGETSDGSRLMAVARRYARAVGDPDAVEAVRLFILEEQRHGAQLGRFLDLAGIAHARKDWGDSLFRSARYCIERMEVWVTPVVMVETHALIYYNAIRNATTSPLLRQLCRQILVDEVPHIRFQCERLAILHRRRQPALKLLTMGAHHLFFAAITLAIWVGHRRALRAGGLTFRRFWSAAWGKMRRSWRLMDPNGYRWN
jgi:hypothetical protein